MRCTAYLFAYSRNPHCVGPDEGGMADLRLIPRGTPLHETRRQEHNTRPLPDLWQDVIRKLRGLFNYFGVTDNSHALYQFKEVVRKLLFKG